MLSRYTPSESYKGLERRSNNERRMGKDRRNLIRFESFGSDRRADIGPRRQEELFWKRALKTN
jgi:hypothetical protein